MTKAELLKQIEELKKQVEELPEDEKRIRTMPVADEKYSYIHFCSLAVNTDTYPFTFDIYPAEENSSIGNYFKSEEDARMVIKAMELEQAIRIRRIELNDGWEPDWGNMNLKKYFIFYEDSKYIKNDILPEYTYSVNDLPVFGYYKTYEIARQIIDEFKEELYWYFKEYYPNKDKMYVWGE